MVYYTQYDGFFNRWGPLSLGPGMLEKHARAKMLKNAPEGCRKRIAYKYEQSEHLYAIGVLRLNISGKGHKMTHVIFGDNINGLPKRSDFYEPTIHAAVKGKIERNDPLLFLPNTIQEKDVGGAFTIFMHGITPDGAKTLIVVKGIKPCFEVQSPINDNCEPMPGPELEAAVKKALLAEQIAPWKIERTTGRPLAHFMLEEIPYIRLSFSTFEARHRAIGALSGTFILVGDDDDEWGRRGTLIYFQKVAREYKFNTTGWNTITKYRRLANRVPGCDYCFEIDGFAYFRAITAEDERTLSSRPWFRKSFNISMSWDIETYSHEMYNEVPKAEDKYDIFIIACVFYWQSEVKRALTKVCLVLGEAFCGPAVFETVEGEQNYLVLCKSERELMRAFIHVIGRMAPDTSLAFNGGNFDWPLCREKIRRYGLLEELYANIHCEPESTRPKKTPKSIHDYCFRTENVKISAEEKKSMLRADFWGMLDIDVHVVYKQIYPNKNMINSQSLKFFLADNKLPSKKDLPYKILFKVYAFLCELSNITREITYLGAVTQSPEIAANLEEFAQKLGQPDTYDAGFAETLVPEIIYEEIEKFRAPIDQLKKFFGVETFDHVLKEGGARVPAREYDAAEALAVVLPLLDSFRAARWLSGHLMSLACLYCWVDSASCQRLMEKRAIFEEKRRISNMAFVTLYEAFYRANGMKVRNFVAGFAFDVGIKFSMRKDRDTPAVTYPGAYVFYPRKRGIIRDKPVTALDFSSLYPSIIMAYNMSPEKSIDLKYPWAAAMVEKLRASGYDLHQCEFTATWGTKTERKGDFNVSGYFVRHNMVLGPNDKPLGRDRAPLVGENMGIFPTILKRLFDLRASVKRPLEKYKHYIEQIQAGKNPSIDDMIKDGIEPTIAGDLEEMEFVYKKLNSEQLAIKVYMNTFYGEQGSSRSAINFVLIAGSITAMGQYNIKMVARQLEEWGYEVIYGDTDSDYIQCSNKTLAPVKKIYDEAIAEIDNMPEF